jgi:tRNA threonylcarbamoyladenosine biosynthesis protein TsaE
MRTITTHSPEETVRLAESLAKDLMAGDFVALIGELGSGKTMFAKGLAKGLGVSDHRYVNSPSFVVLKEYRGAVELYHFDVYRLDMKGFCDTLDHEKYFYGKGVTVVEWADKIRDILPEEYLEILIEYGEHDERAVTFMPVGRRYKEIVRGLGNEGKRACRAVDGKREKSSRDL